MLALGLLLLLWGQSALELEVPHGDGAVLQVLPSVSVDSVDLEAQGVEVVRGDLGQHLAPKGVAAALEDLAGDPEVLVLDLLLGVDLTPDEVRVVPEKGDDRVVTVNKHVGGVGDRNHSLRVEVGGGVVWEFLVPGVHFVAEHLGLVDVVLVRVDGVGEDGVGELLSELCDFARRDAVDFHAEGHGEGGLVLQQGDLVDDGAVQLGRGGAGVHHVRIQIRKELGLQAVDGLPDTPVGPSEG